MTIDLTELRKRDQVCITEIVAARDAMFVELEARSKNGASDAEAISRFFAADQRFKQAISKHDEVIEDLRRTLARQG